MLFSALITSQFAALLASFYDGRQVGRVAYYNPNANGGSQIDDATGLGQPGEPLNVIVSGLSSPDVLTDAGFLNYVQSLGFSWECLGLHLGGPQSANLGDGNGWVDQTVEYREDYREATDGTCLETLIGGNHLRMFRQNGTEANSGALFLAVSKKEDLEDGHDIIPDGYNIGRNELASAAIAGQTSQNGVIYSTTAENVTGLLQPGPENINHNISQDGIVTVLTVSIISQ